MLAPPDLPADTACTGQDAADWAVALLQYRACPITEANVYSFAGWFQREGGGGANNPMNSTLGDQYPAINSAGVRDYPTPMVGIEETWATLDDGYTAIEGAFHAGAGLGYPSAQVQAELREWSGGGYWSITPVVVPMPPIPSFHYGYYDPDRVRLAHGTNSERNVVENYDTARRHPKVRAKQLQVIELNCAFLVTRLENVMRDDHDPHGLKFHRAYRLNRLRERALGEIVKPDLG